MMTRRDFACSLAALAASPAFAEEDSSQLAHTKKWFKEAQFGMMAHWGLYTLLGGEWRGASIKHKYAEHIMSVAKIPRAEYAALAKAFNPSLPLR